MRIGERIKNRRKELGMGVEELAQKLGKAKATVYRYENGDIENLPLDILEPIATALSVAPEYLMGWEKVQKENDAIVDIVVRLRNDKEFLSVVESLNQLDQKKLAGVKVLLATLFE